MIPGLGRSPGEGNRYPLQYSGLENSMDSVVHGVTKSRTQLSDFHFLSLIGKSLWSFCPFIFPPSIRDLGLEVGGGGPRTQPYTPRGQHHLWNPLGPCPTTCELTLTPGPPGLETPGHGPTSSSKTPWTPLLAMTKLTLPTRSPPPIMTQHLPPIRWYGPRF